jgi:hypothetical protein
MRLLGKVIPSPFLICVNPCVSVANPKPKKSAA